MVSVSVGVATFLCRACAALTFACVAIFSQVALADVFDFETTPTGTIPTDNTALSSSYPVTGSGNVRFFFDANGNNTFDAGIDLDPIFEQVGNNPIDAWENNSTGAFDVARTGFEGQLGNFSLRSQSTNFEVPPPFIAAYTGTLPITALSGEIWDIDGQSGRGTEQWLVDVLNSSGQVVATLTSPSGSTNGVNSLDAKPWEFDFANLPANTQSVRVSFIGTATSIGFSLNNFSVAVPEPSSIALAALSFVGLLAIRRFQALR